MWSSALSSGMAVRSSHYHMAGLFFAVGSTDGRLPEISKASYSQPSPFRGTPHLQFYTTSGVAGCGDWEKISNQESCWTGAWCMVHDRNSKWWVVRAHMYCISRVFTLRIHDVELWFWKSLNSKRIMGMEVLGTLINIGLVCQWSYGIKCKAAFSVWKMCWSFWPENSSACPQQRMVELRVSKAFRPATNTFLLAAFVFSHWTKRVHDFRQQVCVTQATEV